MYKNPTSVGKLFDGCGFFMILKHKSTRRRIGEGEEREKETRNGIKLLTIDCVLWRNVFSASLVLLDQ